MHRYVFFYANILIFTSLTSLVKSYVAQPQSTKQVVVVLFKFHSDKCIQSFRQIDISRKAIRYLNKVSQNQ